MSSENLAYEVIHLTGVYFGHNQVNKIRVVCKVVCELQKTSMKTIIIVTLKSEKNAKVRVRR